MFAIRRNTTFHAQCFINTVLAVNSKDYSQAEVEDWASCGDDLSNIDRDEIMACGDGDNDLEMLKAVGFGVAMGNAEESVKAVADYVTDTNEEEGVAKAVEKFALR